MKSLFCSYIVQKVIYSTSVFFTRGGMNNWSLIGALDVSRRVRGGARGEKRRGDDRQYDVTNRNGDRNDGNPDIALNEHEGLFFDAATRVCPALTTLTP